MSIGGLELRTLQGERLVVTGGSRGLGLGIVAALLARGAQVPWSPAIRGGSPTSSGWVRPRGLAT
jgi:hypothetical protein